VACRGALWPWRQALLGALFLVVIVVPAHAQVRVGVNIGVQLPGPPTLVVVPGTPVYYAPQAPANVFFYAHQYWILVNGGWYVGPTWNGPWAVVEPGYVPAPILQVPVGYYPVPTPHWTRWRHEAPPEWESHYGHEWREEPHERAWREREERWDRHEGKGCPPGLAKQGRC
jgi:hypothetical protein